MRSTFLRHINQLIALRSLFSVLLIVAAGIQLIIISFNHYTGFHSIKNIPDFIIRLIIGTSLTLIAGILLTIPNLALIYRLNKFFLWHTAPIRRLILQLSFSILWASIIAVAITLFSNFLNKYDEPLAIVLYYNIIMSAVLNIILMAILEAWLFFIENNKTKAKADNLKKELTQIRFEMLKSQINPHFMFNSLNVLSGLIDSNVEKAQDFIEQFSLIYRYVLETIEQPMVSMKDELNFVHSYIALQQMRYGVALQLSINIEADILKKQIPPLSLQIVLENAIKHNVVNTNNPLKIEMFNKNTLLIVQNNLQPKISQGYSSGLGLSNLKKRFSIIGAEKPEFIVTNTKYIARIPLQ